MKCTGKTAPLLSPNQLGNLTCNKIDTLSNNTVSCSSDQIPRNVRKFDADDNLSITMATDSRSILSSQNYDDGDDDDVNVTDEDNHADALNNVTQLT